ncbi:hypothetical protein EZI54_07330 [Marinobacter halodurans]|uniref:AP2 domain-containing protein n=1 Tax=Marinobacter halodurans TaxID=2528979 RepID=A0ABY1ZMI0_9GAMM|nr:hypothetical protein [Marinobacter halodurans]TBW57463.1 hypothetical protein EZI54_07330 [Marinobacter halodurans]
MGIRFYNKGEHAGGFVGFRVSRSVDGKPRQEYFKVTDTDPESINYKRGKLEAYRLALAWEEEAQEKEYQRFVNEDSPQTTPERASGVHRLTLGFVQDKRKNWVPAFIVTGGSDRAVEGRVRRIYRVFTMQSSGLKEAWSKAVHFWAEVHDIHEADRRRVLINSPDPTKFKELRRFECEVNGKDIPVEAIRAAFKEQRDAIRMERLATSAHKAIGERPSTTAADIYAWFEQESRS